MGRKYAFLMMATIFLFILTGCNSKQFNEAMEKGKAAIEASNYEEATLHLNNAIDLKDSAEAETLLKQTKQFVDGYERLQEGKLQEAKEAFEGAVVKEGSSTLNDRAKKEIADLASLQEKVALFESMIDDIHKFQQSEQYDEALQLTEKALNEDFTAPSVQHYKEQFEQIKKELIEEQQAFELEEKSEALIASVFGYWRNTEHDFQFCKFTKENYVCPTAGSDEYYYGDIKKWEADAKTGKITMHLDNAPSFTTEIVNGLLILNNGKYKKITREEVAEDNFGVDVDSFFNIDTYKAFDGS